MIFIRACNPGDKTLSAETSLLVHANDNVSHLNDRAERETVWRIFVPGHGYCDTTQQRRRVIAQLEQELRANGRKDLKGPIVHRV